MATVWHFEQEPFGRTLRIYAFDPDRRLQFRLIDSDGGVRQDVLEEGAVPLPFLEMAWDFSGPFIEGFKQFLGQQAVDAANKTVPKEIYEREAARVDKFIDNLFGPEPSTQTFIRDDG